MLYSSVLEPVFLISRRRFVPYLLRDIEINRSNQVWCTDITYIPMSKGFLYLVAIMDWYSRKVLSWCLSNTTNTYFCAEALEEAIEKYGCPNIFNSEQGSQFTSMLFESGSDTKKGIRKWVRLYIIERPHSSLSGKTPNEAYCGTEVSLVKVIA